MQLDRVRSIQADCYAEDVAVPAGADRYTDSQLEEYFHSGGAAPLPALQLSPPIKAKLEARSPPKHRCEVKR